MLKDCVWKMFGQIMSRTFINDKDFYRNPEWVHASSEYVELSALAGYELRAFPKWAKKFAAPFLPSCQKLQSLFDHINLLLKPLKKKLDEEKLEIDPSNPLSFLHQKLEGRSDELGSMLIALCLVSYDGGGELFTHVLHSVWRNDQLIRDLRSEIINVVGNEGFNKNTLQNLVLMDSALKEAMRMHPESVRKSHSPANQEPHLTVDISPNATNRFRGSRVTRWTHYPQRNSTLGIGLPYARRFSVA
jgi:cytochrome P450 monooxygenase-1